MHHSPASSIGTTWRHILHHLPALPRDCYAKLGLNNLLNNTPLRAASSPCLPSLSLPSASWDKLFSFLSPQGLLLGKCGLTHCPLHLCRFNSMTQILPHQFILICLIPVSSSHPLLTTTIWRKPPSFPSPTGMTAVAS